RASIRFHRCRTAIADAGAVMLAPALLDDGAMSSIALMMYQHGTTRCWRAWHSRTAGFWGSGCKISAPLAGSVLRCGCSEVKLGRVYNQHDGAPAAIFSQDKAQRAYGSHSTVASCNTGLRKNGPGPKGCAQNRAILRCAAWS